MTHDRREHARPSAKNAQVRAASDRSSRGCDSEPLVSVVVTCFNHARFLGEAIESVLAQSCQDFELIFIDDGSTDATPDVAARYDRVRYFRQTNQGLPAARNAGLDASRGRYLVFLDADDRLLPDALKAGLQCFAEHPQCAFVSGGHRRIDEAGTVIELPTPPHVEHDHYTWRCCGATMWECMPQ